MKQMIHSSSFYPEEYYLLSSPSFLKSLVDSPLALMVKIYNSIDNLILWLVVTNFWVSLLVFGGAGSRFVIGGITARKTPLAPLGKVGGCFTWVSCSLLKDRISCLVVPDVTFAKSTFEQVTEYYLLSNVIFFRFGFFLFIKKYK